MINSTTYFCVLGGYAVTIIILLCLIYHFGGKLRDFRIHHINSALSARIQRDRIKLLQDDKRDLERSVDKLKSCLETKRLSQTESGYYRAQATWRNKETLYESHQRWWGGDYIEQQYERLRQLLAVDFGTPRVSYANNRTDKGIPNHPMLLFYRGVTLEEWAYEVVLQRNLQDPKRLDTLVERVTRALIEQRGFDNRTAREKDHDSRH